MKKKAVASNEDATLENIDREFYALLERHGPITADKLSRGEISLEEAKSCMFDVLLGDEGALRLVKKLLNQIKPKRGRGQPRTAESKAFYLNLLLLQEWARRLGKEHKATVIARQIAEIEIDIEDTRAGRKPSKHSREKRIATLAANYENRMAEFSKNRKFVNRWIDLAKEGVPAEERIKIIVSEDHK